VLYPQRLYNEAQDTRATAAKTTATALSSNPAFDNAIANTSELFKKQQESLVRDARALMTRRVANWSTWRDVSEACEEIASDLGLNDADNVKAKQTAFDEELKKVGEAQGALNEQLKTLQDTITRAGQAAGDVKMAGEWLARLGQLAPTADLILQKPMAANAEKPGQWPGGEARRWRKGGHEVGPKISVFSFTNFSSSLQRNLSVRLQPKIRSRK
jgi:hypothetical protein